MLDGLLRPCNPLEPDGVAGWLETSMAWADHRMALAAAAAASRQALSDRRWEGTSWRRGGGTEPGSALLPPRPPDPTDALHDDLDKDRRKDKDAVPSRMTYVWDPDRWRWDLVERPRLAVAGPFYAFAPVPAKHVELLRHLLADPDTPLCDGFYRRELVPRLNRTHPVSLRVLDWFMVDYAQAHKVAYMYPVRGRLELVDVHDKYSRLLKCWRRRRFDCFRRRHRVYLDLDGVSYATTVAQLHFFYVAHMYGFLEYTRLHLAEVDAHMKDTFARAAAVKRKRGGEAGPASAAAAAAPRKRQPLVRRGPPTVFVSDQPYRMSFHFPDSKAAVSS